MADRLGKVLDQVRFSRMLRRWSMAADEAAEMNLAGLRGLRGRARQIRREVDRVIHQAESRLAAPPNLSLAGPPGTDWIWRPEIWRGPLPHPGLVRVPARTDIAPGATLFHDCRDSEILYRQIANDRPGDRCPFGLRLDVFGFDGSFLSLAVDLPLAAAEGLKMRHLVRLEALIEMERPIGILARLNIKHGPNIEQLVRDLPVEPGARGEAPLMVEFDLAYSKLNEKRIEKLWLDLIFDGPAMNMITLRDLTLSRRPRAEL